MKNLFKKLMLVAVAAMAFTACSQDVNEVNKVAKKTVISGVLSFDEGTRSGFVGTETTDNGDGTTTTVYKSAWEGGDTIKLFADNGLETTATVDAEGKFTAQFEGELPESFFMTICSPAESWSSQYSSTIPAEQTPLANSVDPVAHILKAQNVYVTNGSADAANMVHEVAYGKMTVNAPEGFVIDNVVVNLKGTYFMNYERECTYTINADNVQNNVFWFTTETFENVTEFTVTAYDAEGNAVAKTVDVAAAGKTLSFNYGRVSTFSVSGLEAPAEPSAPVFTSAYASGYSYSDFNLIFESSALGKLVLNPYNLVGNDWVLQPGTYAVGSYSGAFYSAGYSYYVTPNEEVHSLNSGTVVVGVKDGVYYIEFVDLKSDTLTLNAIYAGAISGLNLPDPRAKLATPSATATADGNVITISWDPITGADEYYVFCYAGGLDAVTTTETSVTIEAAYNTKYDFLMRAVANDSNADYKTSDDYYFSVTTGKDPNKFADVVANNIVWDSSNGAFKMTGEVVSGTAWGHSSDYIRLYINENDRPGNNSIKVGTYTGCGGTNPQAGQFGARLCLYWGTLTYPSAVGSSSTVDVAYDEAVGYTIILTHNNVTYGYKGMPHGWVAPAVGGEEPGPDQPGGEEPEPDQPGGDVVADGLSIATAYTFTTYSTYQDFGYPVMCLSGAENGATFNFESNSQVGFPTGMHKFNDGAWYPALCEYKINGEAQAVDFVNSVIWVEGDNINGYTVEYIYIVTDGGNGIYYKYDGKFFM